jgi:hypothetical protein
MKEYHKGNKNKHSEIMTNAIGRKISQYTHDNKLIESFDSIKIAMKKTKISSSNISHVLAGRNKKAGGFIWKYAELKDTSLVEQQNQEGST